MHCIVTPVRLKTPRSCLCAPELKSLNSAFPFVLCDALPAELWSTRLKQFATILTRSHFLPLTLPSHVLPLQRPLMRRPSASTFSITFTKASDTSDYFFDWTVRSVSTTWLGSLLQSELQGSLSSLPQFCHIDVPYRAFLDSYLSVVPEPVLDHASQQLSDSICSLRVEGWNNEKKPKTSSLR